MQFMKYSSCDAKKDTDVQNTLKVLYIHSTQIQVYLK